MKGRIIQDFGGRRLGIDYLLLNIDYWVIRGLLGTFFVLRWVGEFGLAFQGAMLYYAEYYIDSIRNLQLI